MPLRKRRQPAAHNLKTTRAGKVKRRNVFWRMRRAVFAFGLLVVTALSGSVLVLSQIKLPPADPPQQQTSFICAANVTANCNQSNAMASLHGNENRVEITDLDQVPKLVQDAVLAAEDRSFFSHGGIDPFGIARAAWNDIRNKSSLQGGSTLTQQYVKNVYLSQERTLSRKLKEAVLSIKLEEKLPKKEIFRRYLNLVYFGRGAYGIVAAAKVYFNKSLDQLNLSDAALLAGEIRYAGDVDPLKDNGRATSLRNSVLDSMEKAKFINSAERDFVAAWPLDEAHGVVAFVPTQGMTWLGGPFGPNAPADQGAEYFADFVRRQLIDQFGSKVVYGGGLRVYTTLDPNLQTIAYQSVNKVLPTMHLNPQPSASLVSIDNSGAVRAMVGGSDFGQSQVNLALGQYGGGSGRQAGSTFKAFALAEAMKEGYSLKSASYAPASTRYPWYDGGKKSVASEAGYFNLVDATAESVNNIFVPLMHQLGEKKVIDMAYALGIPKSNSILPPVPSIVLGAGAVAPYDMAAAYSTFMDGGVHVTPFVITKVTDSTGKVLYEAAPTRKTVLTPEQNGRVVYALQQVLKSGTARGNGPLGYPAAGKTGTTDSSTDIWFIGFTPNQLTTAVWIGYSNSNKSLGTSSSAQGAGYPTVIWHDFMTQALANAPHPDFSPVNDLWGGDLLKAAQGSYQGSGGPPTTHAPRTTAAPTAPSTTAAPTTTVAASTPPTTKPPVTTPSTTKPAGGGGAGGGGAGGAAGPGP